MTLTRNAIGNLINRYKAVLKKCNLCNAFGSLAVAAMLVFGGADMAMADSDFVVISPTEKAAMRYDSSGDAKGGQGTIDRGDSTVKFNGGFALHDAIDNSLTMTGGDAKGLYGGYAAFGKAEDNSVKITGGTVAGNVYGGFTATSGQADGNSVEILGGTVDGAVYGGFSLSGATTNNTVTLAGDALVKNNVYGGSNGATGNTLRVEGKSKVTGEIGNFQNYTFAIPKSFQTYDPLTGVGDTLLEAFRVVLDANANAKIVRIEGDRNVGDKFRLMESGVAGSGKLLFEGTPIGFNPDDPTLIEAKSADNLYKYSLSYDSSEPWLFAIIREVLGNGKDFGSRIGGEFGRMFDAAFASGEVRPSFADDYSKPAGVRFLSRAINPNYGNGSGEAAKTVESVTQAAAVAAVPQMAVGANLAGVGAIGQRTTIGQPTGSLQSMSLGSATGLNSGDDIKGLSAGNGYNKNGFAMWVMPLWQSNNSFGMKSGEFEMDSHASIGGIAIGADYTFDQAFRLGLTLNMGGGYAEGSGDLATTTNNMNFWGVGAYAGWMCDNFGLTADVNYTSTHNNIRQEMDPSFAMQDMESEVMASTISAGLRAEYRLNTDALDIIPHLGVRFINLTTYGYDVENSGQSVLEADTSTQNIWTFPVGVQFARSFDMDNGWYVRPSLDLNVTPAAGDINVKREVRFTGVTASASPETQTMDWVTYGGQAGLEFGNDNVKLGLNYSLQAGAHTTNHGVFASFRYEF